MNSSDVNVFLAQNICAFLLGICQVKILVHGKCNNQMATYKKNLRLKEIMQLA